MRNIKAIIEYDGSHYCGFQTQLKPGIPTVQETLEAALLELFGTRTPVICAGRTDSGVHALGQVINFYTEHQIPLAHFPMAVNHRLPADVVIKSVEEVPMAFHARKYALGKHYQYRVYNHKTPTAFGNQYCYWTPYTMDDSKLQEACSLLEGTHNFKAFCAAGSTVKTFTRTLYYAKVTRKGSWLYFDFYGNGFLYNMVRIMVGTLLEIGSGRKPVSTISKALNSQNRKDAGRTAPPTGLYLKKVFYP